jgi:hypothetical protein
MQDRTIEISAKTWNLRLILFEIQGMIALGTYMKTYRVGDIVDIKANGAVQKGVRESSTSNPLAQRSQFHLGLKRNPNLKGEGAAHTQEE